MPDRHIDYHEVSEYGRNFVTALPTLAGLSDLVDIEKLAARVLNKVTLVENELQSAVDTKSELRTGRTDTSDAEENLRDVITRFFHYLHSVPKSVAFDLESFFEGKVMGDLSRMKPADLVAKGSSVLRGFATDKNKTIASFAPWLAEISTAHATLDNAVTGKDSATGRKFVATAGLIAARIDFLHTYNKVAKPIVRGILNDLNRSDELKHFFKDLAVNEGGTSGNSSPDNPTG